MSIGPNLKNCHNFRRLLFHFDGPESGSARCMRRAMVRNRAGVAVGLFGKAYQRAQIHQGLIEIPGPGGRNQRCRLCFKNRFALKGVCRFTQIKSAAQDTNYIAIHGRRTLSEGDAGNRAGYIGSETRKQPERIPVSGEISPMGIGDYPCGPVKIFGTAVVAESLPFREDGFEGCAGKGFQRRKPDQKSGVAFEDGFDPRLLKHYLRNPNPVRIRFAAPWEHSFF